MTDIGTPDRIAVLAHWSDSAVVNRSFRTLVREFSVNGYLPIIVSAAEFDEPLDWSGGLPGNAVVLRKPNLGYDFGSWAIAIDRIPAISCARYVVLANDSVIGPFASLQPLLRAFEGSAADVWGLTDTRQYFLHLQSYFLGFRNGVLAEPVLRAFWAGVRDEPVKWNVINNNELGLSRLLYREGFAATAAFRGDDIVAYGENPVIRGWWILLENGFPFVKREIVRNPSVAPNGEAVAREVKAVYGVELDDWI